MLSWKTMNKLVLNSNAFQIKQPIQKDRYTVLFEKELEKSPSLTAISDGLTKNEFHIDYNNVQQAIQNYTGQFELR